jgi:hypothetical protein
MNIRLDRLQLRTTMDDMQAFNLVMSILVVLIILSYVIPWLIDNVKSKFTTPGAMRKYQEFKL